MVASSLPEAEAAYLAKVLPALGSLLALVLVGAAVFVACPLVVVPVGPGKRRSGLYA